MDLKLYAIYDKKTTEYGNPFCELNNLCAIRKLNTELKNPNSMLVQHKDDYTLYNIGFYDTQTGMTTSDIPPIFVEELTNIIS